MQRLGVSSTTQPLQQRAVLNAQFPGDITGLMRATHHQLTSLLFELLGMTRTCHVLLLRPGTLPEHQSANQTGARPMRTTRRVGQFWAVLGSAIAHVTLFGCERAPSTYSDGASLCVHTARSAAAPNRIGVRLRGK